MNTPDFESLTQRQQNVLLYIYNTVTSRGYPPSIREIGDSVGLKSTSSVAHQLHMLEKKGFLTRDPNKPRAVDVYGIPGQKPRHKHKPVPVPKSSDGISQAVFVPLVGRISAGSPVLAEQSIEQVFPLPLNMVGGGELFMIKMVGDSMSDAAICDGDYVVVRQQSTAESGDLVAALINEEATVKIFHRDLSGERLLPRNPAYNPTPLEEATLLGTVVTTLRKV